MQKETSKRWLTIVGIGEDGLCGLGQSALSAIQNADIVFGGGRHLAMIEQIGHGEKRRWPKPFLDVLSQIEEMRGKNVVVLASGDPMFYGAGATLVRYFKPEELMVYPYSSSFSYASARLGWPLQNVVCLSVHGRALTYISRKIENGARLLILANDGQTPAQIANLLIKQGFGSSKLHVLERLGGPEEHHYQLQANEIGQQRFDDLNVIAISCIATNGCKNYARNAPLPDNAFVNDGQLTKQDIRAITLGHLAPSYNELLWDVGAGCGSISIEWLRLGHATRAIAIEQNERRCQFIRHNALTLGVPNLEVIQGCAPEALRGLEAPDAIFIGGGFSDTTIVKLCWNALKTGGKLIANAVTVESEAAMAEFAMAHQGQLLRFSVSSAEPLGRFHVWRQALPVTMLAVCKK